MAKTRALFLNTLQHFSTHILIFFLIFPHHHIHAEPEGGAAAAAAAPSPSSTSSTPWPIDIIAILKKGEEFGIFIKFLDTTNHLGNQINTQLVTSDQGITVLAPTDSAFGNLPTGALNKLTPQQKVQLIEYHVLPKFYSLDDLETASNPVGTQASGADGEHFWLNFTGHNNQVNVTSGVVETQVSNTLRKKFPLAVYQIDKVLLPVEFSRAHNSTTVPKNGKGKPNATAVAAPAAAAPKEASPENEPSSAGRIIMRKLGLLGFGVVLFCMGLL